MPVTCTSPLTALPDATTVNGSTTLSFDAAATPEPLRARVTFEIVDPSSRVYFSNGTKQDAVEVMLQPTGTTVTYMATLLCQDGDEPASFPIEVGVFADDVPQCPPMRAEIRVLSYTCGGSAWQGAFEGGAARKGAAKKSGAKKSSAKKSAAKKSAAKKSAAKKSAAKKSVAKKSAAKRTAAKKTSARKSAGKRTAAKGARKATAKRTTAKRGAARKSTAKRASAKKSATKRATAKRVTAKRSAAKRGARRR